MPDPGNRTFHPDGLGEDASRLLLVLLSRIDDTRCTQVPTSVLMGAARLTQGSMLRARSELEERGLLWVEPGYSRSGLRGPNVYRLSESLPGNDSPASTEGESGQNETDAPTVTPLPVRRSLPEPSGRRHAGPGRLRTKLKGWLGSS
jgi:hypothetical protein